MKPTGIKLLIEPALPRATIVACIHHCMRCDCTSVIINWARSKGLWQRVPLHARLWLLPKVYSFVTWWEKSVAWGVAPACSWQIEYIGPVTFLSELSVVPHHCWHFSGIDIAVPGQLNGSGRTIMALETYPCYTFGFLDHLQSDSGAPFMTKPLNNKSVYLMDLLCFLPSTGVWYMDKCWMLEQPLQKLSQRFLILHPSSAPSPHLNKSVLSLNVAALRKGSSHLDQFLSND